MGLPGQPGMPNGRENAQDLLGPNVGSDDAPERHAWDLGWFGIFQEHEKVGPETMHVCVSSMWLSGGV